MVVVLVGPATAWRPRPPTESGGGTEPPLNLLLVCLNIALKDSVFVGWLLVLEVVLVPACGSPLAGVLPVEAITYFSS
ncbi:uncharacterized protein MELLADRAFT_92115 [Melampsora larici-populina 98AG31]|uniref:Uncharacterized protein n=1 Tax=Melampsora larici-populina (strain 98AG31 / pathotype 3-4-7) TaxID=747676 RepID=F4S1J5_MELLP|nr:uncharacterized protein MELLADRAFT_92115 [Melampsora larici-populina 98AG31]EGG01493.1 hypothetical protein MELLADRAFT_92115 [Melampsora larici-populina 98AG31]